MTEDLLSVYSLSGSTTDKNIFKEVKTTLIQYKLKSNLLRCVTNDGVKNMCGSERGLVEQIYKAYENVKSFNPMVIHYIIHHKVLCEKYLNLTICY